MRNKNHNRVGVQNIEPVHYLYLFFLVCLCACSPPSNNQSNRVCINKSCFDVEVVSKDEDRYRGLQHRTSLEKDHGMLFIFPTSRKHGFWMKDTLISLDMIWLDYSRRVVHIEKDVPPCTKDPCPSYIPIQKALYVLEINAGMVEEKNIMIGQMADFHIVE